MVLTARAAFSIIVVAFYFSLRRGGCPRMFLFKLDLLTPGGPCTVISHEVNNTQLIRILAMQAKSVHRTSQTP